MKARHVRRATPFLGIVTLLALVVAHGVQMGLVQAAALTETTPNLKAAFLGDLGLSGNAQAALQLVQAEGADIVLHQGDFGYNETDSLTPTNWDERITSILGGNFPYFGSVGNHVVGQWTDYQQLLQARLDRIAGAAYTAGLPGSVVVTITSDDQAPTYIDNRAISEVTSSGDVTLGDFNSTFASDDVA